MDRGSGLQCHRQSEEHWCLTRLKEVSGPAFLVEAGQAGNDALASQRSCNALARHKPRERHSPSLPVVLSEQIVPDGFAFALHYLVGHELSLTAMDAKIKSGMVGSRACTHEHHRVW